MHYHRPLLLTASLLTLLLSVVMGLELSNTTHFFHAATPSAKTASPTIYETNGTKPTATTPTTSGSVEKTPPGTVPATAIPDSEKRSPASSTTLLTPSGTFVSAHKSVPIDATLSSVCNTTSGAQCQITFTMGNVVKSLDAQTADRVGAVYWNSWTPAGIGLTAGQWQVTATATYNGQTETSTDSLALEIKA